MKLIPVTDDPAAYLAADDVIDHTHPVVRERAAELRAQASEPVAYARAAFVFVRDTIGHSFDTGDPRVTWRASDVLRERTGICYAKAHALTALLRAGGIPAALCYQRLGVIHGLVALRLPDPDRWVRQDPRGNRPGVDAQFSTGPERLAYRPDPDRGECDLPLLHAAPAPAVLRALRAARDREHLESLLPAEL